MEENQIINYPLSFSQTETLSEVKPPLFFDPYIIFREKIKALEQDIVIQRAEIAKIWERISKLEERLTQAGGQQITQAGGQQIIPIQFLESEKLQLKQLLSVRCVYSPQSNIYIVDHFELNIYGEGRDEKEAVNDFKLSLEETYFDLKKDKDKLGPSLQKEWQLLSEIVEEK